MLLAIAAPALLAGCDQMGLKWGSSETAQDYSDQGIYKILTLPSLSTGTGFLVNDQNLVVTNRHVVTDEGPNGQRIVAPNVKIIYVNKGKFELVDADILKISSGEQEDLALLRPQRRLPGKPVQVADYSPHVGSDVKAIGYPGAADIAFKGKVRDAVQRDARFKTAKSDIEKYSIFIDVYLQELERQYKENPAQFSATQSQGVVQKLAPYDNVPVVQHQAPINPGNSGGPLFDACDHVVGVNTFLPKGSQGIFMSLGSPWVVQQVKAAGHEIKTSSRCLSASMKGYMPLAVGGTLLVSIMLMLVTMTMLIVFRRSPVVQRGYTLITRGTASPRAKQAKPADASVAKVADQPMAATVAQMPVSAAQQDPPMQLVPTAGGPSITMEPSMLRRGATLGRETSSDIVVQDKTVSKRHARLALDPSGRLIIEDLGSANGTWKGRSKITREAFRAGESVKFGSAEFRVESQARGEPARANGQATGPGQASGAPERSILLTGMDPDGRPLQLAFRSSAERTWTVGRKAGVVDVVIANQRVSSEHARVRYTPGKGFEVLDLGSSNGTKLDGKPVSSEYVSLEQARSIEFGDVKLDVNKL